MFRGARCPRLRRLGGSLACGSGGPTGRGLLSRRGASVALGEVSSPAVGRLLEGRLWSFRRGVLACGSGGPTGRGLLSRRGASVALGEVSSPAVGRLLEGRFCSFRRGVLACGSGGPTGRGEVRVGRVSWGGVGGPHPSAADVAGTARGLRAVSEEKGHMYTSTRGAACLPTRGNTCLGVQT